MKYYYGVFLVALASPEAPREKVPDDALKALKEHVRLQDVSTDKLEKEEYRYDVEGNGKTVKKDEVSEEEDDKE